MADRNYAETYRRSMTEPEAFWAEQAASLRWTKPWDRVLADNGEVPPKQMHRWFEGGELNTCDNALDRWIDEGRGEQAALIYDSPLTNTLTTFSYRELRDRVAVFAGALRANGVNTGDRVVIYMPMIPEIGRAHSELQSLMRISYAVFCLKK